MSPTAALNAPKYQINYIIYTILYYYRIVSVTNCLNFSVILYIYVFYNLTPKSCAHRFLSLYIITAAFIYYAKILTLRLKSHLNLLY